MNIQGDLTEQQLIQIVSHIQLSHPQTICDNRWCFNTYYASLSLVYQSFIIEFTKQWIDNINYRQGIHTLCSEIYQANQN